MLGSQEPGELQAHRLAHLLLSSRELDKLEASRWGLLLLNSEEPDKPVASKWGHLLLNSEESEAMEETISGRPRLEMAAIAIRLAPFSRPLVHITKG